jgi:transcriptional regulator with XRE-family HTH domain
MTPRPTSRENDPARQDAALALATYHRQALAEDVRTIGIREVARRADIDPMRVSRFADSTGSHDAATLYRIAAALGYKLTLS